MPAHKTVWSKLKPEDRDRFVAFLDGLPENERPVYGFSGVKSSAWQKLGGGTNRVVVLFFKDRVVFSTRGVVGSKEQARRERPLTEITEIREVSGPMFSSVEFRFSDGSKTKLADVMHRAAAPVSKFMADGLAAFERSQLDAESLTDFFYASNLGLPLPDDLFSRASSV